MSAHVAMVLVGVSLLDTKKTDAESPVDIFLSISQKQSKTCRVESYMLPGAAEFCTVLFTLIFTNNGVHGEKLQLFCLQ